jgi:hypothetical protein
MLEAIREFKRRLDALDRSIRGVRAVQIDRADIRDAVRSLVDMYFRDIRGNVAATTPPDIIARCDLTAHVLLEATHRRSATATFKTNVKELQTCAFELEKSALLTAAAGQVVPIDADDQRIIDTLRSLLPSAALSYEQALLDLRASQRLSWRGPATDMREALRETLDHLAPDADVTGQAGFKLESGTNGPTMKQKVRFVLRKRGVSRSAMQTPEAAVEAVDEAVGTFVRSVYTRSNLSTHTPTDRTEVIRVRDWVRAALRELLALE